MTLKDFFNRLATRAKERRRKELEQTADRLVTLDIDDADNLYVCVAGVRIRMAVEHPDKTTDIDIRNLAVYVNTIKLEYIRQHNHDK